MMKNKKVVGIIVCILFIGLSFVPSISSYEPTLGGTIYVDDDNTSGPWDGSQDYPYQYIQDGVNATVSGDTVFVYSGTYYEFITINKQLKLVGADKNNTFIDGNYGNPNNPDAAPVFINSDLVEISGFTIRNCHLFGVYIRGNDCIIHDNIITNCDDSGIYSEQQNDNTISGNNINNNLFGIHLNLCNNSSIIRNNISNNGGGIQSQDSFRIYITENNIEKNNIGIYLSNMCYSILRNFAIVEKNNLIDNFLNAVFTDSFLNKWSQNYWSNWTINIPKPIFGIVTFPYFALQIPFISFDWHPAKEPYDVP